MYSDPKGVIRFAYAWLGIYWPAISNALRACDADIDLSLFPSLPAIDRHLGPSTVTLRRTKYGIELANRGTIPLPVGAAACMGIVTAASLETCRDLFGGAPAGTEQTSGAVVGGALQQATAASPYSPLPADTMHQPAESAPVATPDELSEKARQIERDLGVAAEQLPDKISEESYQIHPFDVLQIYAAPTAIDQPLDNYFVVESNGQVNLGKAYGWVKVKGLTAKQARVAVLRHLEKILKKPTVKLTVGRKSGATPTASPPRRTEPKQK